MIITNEKQQLWLFFTVKCSFADPNPIPLFGQKPSANSCNVCIQRSSSGWQFELARSRVCVLTACQANIPSCPPTQYTVAPRTAPTIMARAPSSAASVVLLKWTGAMHANISTVIVSVNKMDTVVLMATIWPNLAKGTMTQKRRGTVEIAVVTVLDTMATPSWLTAYRVRLRFSLSCSDENSTV